MADDSQQREQGTAPRVYKASQVHKRRPGKAPRTKANTPQDALAALEADASATKPAARSVAKQEPGVVPRREAVPRQSSQPVPQEQSQSQSQAQLQPQFQPQAQAQSQPQPQPQSEPKAEPEASPQPTPQPTAAPVPAPTPAEESAPQPTERPTPTSRKQPRVWLRVLLGVLGVFVAALLVCVGFLSADRWMLRDDHAMMLGEWYVDGAPASIIINDDKIILNAETRYDYAIDDKAKTITYNFGDLQGQGHYWFSNDRKYLVIEDGTDFTPWGTALEDWTRQARDLFDDVFSGGAKLPSGDNIIVLSRTAPAKLNSAGSGSSASVAPTESSSGQSLEADHA